MILKDNNGKKKTPKIELGVFIKSYSKINLPISEKIFPSPDSFYGSIKYTAEEIIKNSGINYVICRLSNIYGTGSGINIPMGALGNFMKALNTENFMQVYGEGNNIIDYIHINDTIIIQFTNHFN